MLLSKLKYIKYIKINEYLYVKIPASGNGYPFTSLVTCRNGPVARVHFSI